MSIFSEIDSAIGRKTRRAFLQGVGATGLTLLCPHAISAAISDATRQSVSRAGKKVTLLPHGDFQGSAWGWQFTKGAEVVDAPGRKGRRAVRVHTDSGDYARFLILGPEAGKAYTLSGWVRTEGIQPSEAEAGAYYTASQFEFQGRPTEFTVDGKQLAEKRFGNLSGSGEWKRFSQTVTCLPTTTYFEVVLGIYRATGTAWFSDVTLVEGEHAADFTEVADIWQALELAHRDSLQGVTRKRPTAAILRDEIPVRGIASDPQQLRSILSRTHEVSFLSAKQLANPAELSRKKYDLLVLPYGESFPLPAYESLVAFLGAGGDLLTTGGYAFQSPVVERNGKWEFYSEAIKHEQDKNLISPVSKSDNGWKALDAGYTDIETIAIPGLGSQPVGKVQVPANLRGQNTAWFFEMPAEGDGKQFYFEGWFQAQDVVAAPDGWGYIGFEQLDEKGFLAYAAGLYLDQVQGSRDWHRVERLITLVPTCKSLRIGFGLQNATGTVWAGGFKLEQRSPQIRINTAEGFPQDELRISQKQLGIFDADFRLKRVSSLHAATEQSILASGSKAALEGDFEGYAATAVTGMHQARWIPVLEAHDSLGRKRGAAGALVHHMRGNYARSSWACFGVENRDLFSNESSLGAESLGAIARSLVQKCFLHACETNYSCYRDGESVQMRVLVSNFGLQPRDLEVRWSAAPINTQENSFSKVQTLKLAAGATGAVETIWKPTSFAASRYRIAAKLFENGVELDQFTSGFLVWKAETLKKGLPFTFKENYFQVNEHSLFLQGTDDYLHTFVDQEENPLTWYEDAQGCRDSCIDVYENLMGLRGPQHRPTEAWWRWIDAMLLGVQDVGGAFFPGMLIFSNTAVSDKDLADQQAYVRTFAERYREANGIMYYLNGDLELHDPNLPDLQKLYNEYLQEKYGSDEKLRDAWKLSPPEAPIGKLTIRSGKDDWNDLRTLDDFHFRTQIVRRWLNALHDSIREVDSTHPVTAEFYQLPTSGIDLLAALGKLELANFGYFNSAGEDYYRFPQVCKFLDQSVRGKGVNIGEFGVKTHPAWLDCGGYISARTEHFEQAYFLAIAHYGFALGASKIQNWCWKYPADLPFEWGINYPNELIARDVRFYYRNSGLLFRHLRPRYDQSEILFLIAGDNRKGGLGASVAEGEMNGIRLLIDQRVRFHTLSDDFIDSIPREVQTIFYPLPYCPSDEVVKHLEDFVDRGGQLYISGDISYDPLRARTKTQRLKDLCGVEFVSERFPNINYQKGALQTDPKGSLWPEYMATPGIVTRVTGAKVLLAATDGTPVVTEYRRGKGRVIFSADPVELHGDPRFQAYAHDFYRALLESLKIAGEKLEPADAPVHVFRVPSQDERQITVLVNYHNEKNFAKLAVTSCGKQVQLGLDALMTGIVVGEEGKGIQAVESTRDVLVEGKPLLGTDLHVMAASFTKEGLDVSRRILLLPMGTGKITLATAERWHQPIVLVGEVSGGKWLEREAFEPAVANDGLTMPISQDRSLSMLILCESAEREKAIQQIEEWVTAPWKLNT